MQYEIPVIPYPKTAALEGGSRPFPLEIAAPDALGEEAARLRHALAGALQAMVEGLESEVQ